VLWVSNPLSTQPDGSATQILTTGWFDISVDNPHGLITQKNNLGCLKYWSPSYFKVLK